MNLRFPILAALILFSASMPAAAQGINVPQSLSVREDGTISLAGNVLQRSGRAELYIITVDSCGNLKGSGLINQAPSTAAGLHELNAGLLAVVNEEGGGGNGGILAAGFDETDLGWMGKEEQGSGSVAFSPIRPHAVVRGQQASLQMLVKRDSHVQVELSSAQGYVSSRLVDHRLAPGLYTLRIDSGLYAAGMYYCVVAVDGEKAMQKLTILP